MSETEPSKVWYLFPVILWWLGGLIAFLALRKRNRNMAFKTLLLGILITVMFLIIISLPSMVMTNQINEGLDQKRHNDDPVIIKDDPIKDIMLKSFIRGIVDQAQEEKIPTLSSTCIPNKNDDLTWYQFYEEGRVGYKEDKWTGWVETADICPISCRADEYGNLVWHNYLDNLWYDAGDACSEKDLGKIYMDDWREAEGYAYVELRKHPFDDVMMVK